MSASEISGSPSLAVNLNYRDYVEAHFLRLAYSEGLMSIVGDGWVTRADVTDAPGEVIGRANYFSSANRELVVRLDGTLCHLILNERSLIVRAAAHSVADADGAIRLIAEALPQVDAAGREVPARFWWWAGNGSMELARMLPSPAWAEVEGNYVGSTRERLIELAGWDQQPPSGGRLVLWHGKPGTGKTNAVRALIHEWREWAEFQFITDPEAFLSVPAYLLGTIGGPRRSQLLGRANPWRIVVLEDAGEFLAPDAKHLKGQALSRLLNVCDGVLGQAMRALVLVTTNEPLKHLHPALARPGRCLSEIEFERFDRDGIERWCAARSISPPPSRIASLADLYAHADGRQPGPIERPMGFAPVLG